MAHWGLSCHRKKKRKEKKRKEKKRREKRRKEKKRKENKIKEKKSDVNCMLFLTLMRPFIR